MITVAAVLAASVEVTDAKGYRNRVPMTADEAASIVKICDPTSAPKRCAALLATISFRESGNNFNAEHDHDKEGHPKGCGAFGVLCTYPHATWDDQVRSAWARILDSTSKCEVPLALYCSGSCDRGHKIAREYLEIARKIAASMP